MSTDYRNSILWRGEDPLKAKFKPAFDGTIRTTRYFPGKAPKWAREDKKEVEEKKVEEQDLSSKKRRRDRAAASVITEDAGAARLRRLQASESAGETGAERLLRHRVVHTAQILEAAPEQFSILGKKGDRDDDLKDKEEKEDFEGVKDVKELKELKDDEDDDDLNLDVEPTKSEAELKSEVKAEVKTEDVEDEDLVAFRRQRARELALLKRKEEEELLKEEVQEEEEDDEESEYETDSEEEDPRQKALLKPVFVSKAQRETVKEKEALEKEEEVAEERRKEKMKERKVESKSLLIDEIKKDVEAENAPEVAEDASDIELIDDNDEINEAEEYELWKIRELKRIKRDNEARMARQKELEFIERRRNMTDEERAADDARLDDGHLSKEEAKKFNFLQKYYHRGTFFQDKATSGEEPLYLRDYHEPTAEETFDKQALPKAMQVRRGLFGKKGQVKHTHLTDVDTTDMSAAWSQHSKQVQKYQERMASAKGVNDFSRPQQSKSASSTG